MIKLRWGLLAILACCGVIYGALTIVAWVHGYEQVIALMILISVGVCVACVEQVTPLRHAFIAGFFTAIAALVTQMLFATIYFQNNPGYSDIELPFGLSPQVFTLLFSPLGGLLAACIAVLATWPSVLLLKHWRNT